MGIFSIAMSFCPNVYIYINLCLGQSPTEETSHQGTGETACTELVKYVLSGSNTCGEIAASSNRKMLQDLFGGGNQCYTRVFVSSSVQICNKKNYMQATHVVKLLL